MPDENDKNNQNFKQTKILDAINCSPSKNFTQISNTVFRMPGLSFKAKGILCSLLSNKDGWVTYKKSLENLGAEGPTAIQSGLNELLEHGFFWSVRYQDKKTKVNKGCFWAYTDEPFKFEIKKQLLILEDKGFEIWKGSIKKLEESYQDWFKKQEVEKQEVGFQVLANQGLIIPNLTNTKFQKEKTIGEVASQPSPSSLENGNTSLDDPKQNKPSKEKESSKTLLAKANRVIKHFNKVTSQNIRLIASNQTPIIARLKVAGTTYKDCIKVIDKKSTHQWFVDSGHMCIETLFRPKNFEKYLNEDTKHYKDQKQPSNNKPSNGSGYTGTRKYKEAIKIKNIFTPIED